MNRSSRLAWATSAHILKKNLYFLSVIFETSRSVSIHRSGPWACWDKCKGLNLVSGMNSLTSSSLLGGTHRQVRLGASRGREELGSA